MCFQHNIFLLLERMEARMHAGDSGPMARGQQWRLRDVAGRQRLHDWERAATRHLVL
jgi:hypothetical protein